MGDLPPLCYEENGNVTCKVCRDVKKMKKNPKTTSGKRMMEPLLCPGTLEVNMDWDRKARRGAAVADKLNYTVMLLTCPVQFIIADELPFSFDESSNYEYFVRVALQPQYRKVARNTLKRRTRQSYYAYRGYLMEMFRTYDGRVSLTSDTWTLTYGEPFVCVTAHWIDDDWVLQKRIVCFEAMEEAHNGFNIKSRLVSCCKIFHLIDKLFSISLDNATANTSAMQFLKKDPSIKLVLNGSLMHVRCCAHMLNLCVQDGLYELRTLAARSAKRIFKQKCEEYGLRKKVIALDTPTRWNSTYKLLHDAIAYRDVLTDIYNESRATDGQFITNDHWSLAKIVHDKTSLANPGAAVKRLLDNMKVKWCAYFTEFPPIYAIATILDPGVKLEGLTNLLTFYYQQLDVQFDVPYYVNNCKHILERLCEDYGAVIQPQLIGSSMDGPGSSSSSSSNIVLARIAKDILAILASIIASESAFSAGRRVLDEKRSRLSSESIDMCVVACIIEKFRVVPITEQGFEPVYVPSLTAKMQGDFLVRIDQRVGQIR
ncbi:putative AC transposase [Bienertia sinuspersici]